MGVQAFAALRLLRILNVGGRGCNTSEANFRFETSNFKGTPKRQGAAALQNLAEFLCAFPIGVWSKKRLAEPESEA